MSMKFNPVSTAVALATAGLMVAVAGCAMNHDGTTVAGDSRDSDRNAERIDQETPADPTVVANQSLPGDQSNPSGQMSEPVQTAQAPIYTEPTAAGTPSPMPADTSATPYPNNQPQSQPMPASTDTTATATTPSSPATYPSSTDTTSSSTSSSTAASSSPSTDQAPALPPRSDRN